MTSTLNVAKSIDLDREESGTVKFTNYLRQNNADPYIFYYNGFYYYTCTGATTINLMKVANIADIKTAAPYTILESTEGKNFWSPEIHYFSAADVGAANAGWYMFIAYDDGTTANQRQHVVKCLDGDNLLGRWGDPVTGEVNKPRRLNFVSHPEINRDMLCGGTSVIRIDGKPYLTYVSEEGRGTADFHQTINIIRFETRGRRSATRPSSACPNIHGRWAATARAHQSPATGIPRWSRARLRSTVRTGKSTSCTPAAATGRSITSSAT